MRTETVTCDNCSGPIGRIPCMHQFIIRTDGDTQRIICSVSADKGAQLTSCDLCGACRCRIAIAAATKALARVAPEQVDESDQAID